jgi:hypothetical protein
MRARFPIVQAVFEVFPFEAHTYDGLAHSMLPFEIIGQTFCTHQSLDQP